MGDTAIGWTHRPGTRGRTWNPVRGCRRKSAGCQHCYAEVQAARIVRMGKGKPTPYDGIVRVVDGEARWTGEISIDAGRLSEPLRWRQPSTVFVDSMSDLFYDKRPDQDIAAVFGVAAACPQHTFLILTKYADRMRAWFEWVVRKEPVAHARAIVWAYAFEHLKDQQHRGVFGRAVDIEERMRPADFTWPLPNVWLGVSVENQEAADERIPELLDTPAAVRFLSCEPLLGEVSIQSYLRGTAQHAAIAALAGLIDEPGIDWLIDGCESGPGARPAQREWFASLEEQCRAAGVAYFHKQEMIGGMLAHDFPGRQEFPR